MVYITGDIHGQIDIGRLSTYRFPQQKKLCRDDYVIICGDFGCVWDGSSTDLYWRKWLSQKKFTTLFVDGNHENFELLRAFPLTEKFGGKVHEIAPHVYHLERGQVFKINGKTFFAMGGARSHDKEYRTPYISWWPEEMPNSAEQERALQSLDACGWKVDYVLTHCAPDSVMREISRAFGSDSQTQFLEYIRQHLDFKKWFFGHYHIDRQIGKRFEAVYDRIIPLE